MAYICDDPVCDPIWDFCWFRVYDEMGAPVSCEKNKVEDFMDGCGYCVEFRCCLHEEKP